MPATEDEKQEAEERSAPTGTVVYEAIFSEGEAELERSTRALFWSGLAAGLSMCFSFVTSSILHASLPNAKWTELIVALGYPVGFIIVILGRQQLFTENTLTVILPLLTKRSRDTFFNVCRLWVAVLVANLIGALLVTAVLAKTQIVSQATFDSMREVARGSQQGAFSVVFLRGIFAGWLIALTVWLLPYAETARVWVIAIITYVIGAAHFSHVIAGAIEAAFLVMTGVSSWAEFSFGFFVPSLLGNIVGGVLLVAVLNHAQVVAGKAE
ncbi:MAG TPA: formate/nitrite transporter family protein [Thermoanaerobaculia bacterium]|nr:formate/nitrite transporter family protein [Thermoanaerobaculia bacterium]